MNRGMLHTAAAMKILEQRLDYSTANLAHAHTPGYKTRSPSAKSFDEAMNSGRVKPTRNEAVVDFSQGIFVGDDGNPLSSAIAGDGFFSVDTPGGEAFTRNGDFTLDAAGQLTTRAGYAVLGEQGPIVASPKDGKVTIDASGAVMQNGSAVGKLRITDFDKKDQLVAVSDTMFRAPSGAGPKAVVAPKILPGHLEYPNHDAVTGLVEMISIHRGYDTASRAMQTIADSIQQRLRG